MHALSFVILDMLFLVTSRYESKIASPLHLFATLLLLPPHYTPHQSQATLLRFSKDFTSSLLFRRYYSVDLFIQIALASPTCHRPLLLGIVKSSAEVLH